MIKPDLTKNTVYQRSFYEKSPAPVLVNYAKGYEKLKGPHLDMNSTYLNGFKGNKGDKLERPHPDDLLKSAGPCPLLTTYGSQFPGHRGDNQYVPHKDNQYRGDFPLRSKSTYANEFIKK